MSQVSLAQRVIDNLWEDLYKSEAKIKELEKKLEEVKGWAMMFSGDKSMRLRKIRLLLYTEGERK